ARGEPEVVCASHGTAFAINVRTRTHGVWTDNGDEMVNEGSGQVQVSALGPTATAWSAAGPPGLTSGAVLAKTGCVGGGVLLGRDDSALHQLQTGAGFWTPGGAWQSVPSPPPSPVGEGSEGLLALVPRDHD